MVLEAGNFSLSSPNLSGERLKNRLIKSRFIVKTYNLLPYDVVNVGLNEVTGGLDFMKYIKKTARKYEPISANIMESKTQKPFFKPYYVKKVGGKKIGVIGLSSDPGKKLPGIEIKDPIETLNKNIVQLEFVKKVDFVVLLAALNQKDYERLKEVKIPVDLALMALHRGRSRYLSEIQGKIIARAGTEGKYIGMVSAKVKDFDKKLSDISRSAYKKSFIEGRLKSYERSAGDKSLDEYFADKPSARRLYNNMLNNRNKLEKEIESAVNPVDFKLIPVELTIPKKPDVQAAIDEFENK